MNLPGIGHRLRVIEEMERREREKREKREQNAAAANAVPVPKAPLPAPVSAQQYDALVQGSADGLVAAQRKSVPIVDGRKFGTALCEVLGLSASKVRSIWISVDAGRVPVARVDLLLNEDQAAEICAAMQTAKN